MNNLKEEILDNNDEKSEEVNNDTKEINLDELYDGSVNNTVVIDPITNDEVFLETKKSSVLFILLLIIIIILLLLYFIKFKTPIGKTTKAVVPNTTTTTIASTTNVVSEEKKSLSGSLTCDYNTKTDQEQQKVIFNVNYKDSKIVDTLFDYNVISLLDSESSLVSSLKNEYESFYINNVSVTGNNVTFIKNDKGFNFKVETNYETVNFDLITLKDEETKLYIKPSSNDTFNSLKESYESIGYKCIISDDANE